MKIENIVRDIDWQSLDSNEKELLERFRDMDEVDRISLIHYLYSTAFEGMLNEIKAETSI